MKIRNAAVASTKPASLADVATLAGVSTGTVSRTLSRPEMISMETRNRVMQAVQELGYVVNGAARALAMRRSHTIGAVVMKFGRSNFAGVIEALESKVSASGYTLLLSAPEPDGDKEFAALSAMLARGVDAIALIGFESLARTEQILARYPIPYAHIWSNQKSGEHCIGIDEVANGRIVLEHLADLGHREIGLIWGHVKPPLRVRSRLRLQGVKAAAKKRGIQILEDSCIYTDHGFEEGCAAAEKIITGKTQATALLCATDYLAIGAMHGLQRNGWSVPQDMSVASFNDNEYSAYVNPPLTTLRLPLREVGMKAGHYLLSQLGEDMGSDPHLLEVQLKIRESCSAPASRK